MSKTYKYKLEAEASLKSLFESISEDSVQFERERIIRLLKTYFKPEEAKSIYPANYEQYLDLIALIKGEQE